MSEPLQISTDDTEGLIDELKSIIKEQTPPAAPKSKATNAPYYQLKYAEELKTLLDNMTPDKDCYIRSQRLNMTPKSLEQRLYYSFQYIIDKLDGPDQKYLKLRQMIQICRKTDGLQHEWGCVLHWRANPGFRKGSVPLQGEAIDRINEPKVWKQELEHFIAHAIDGEKFEKEVLITQQELDGIVEMCASSEDLILHPKSTTTWIKIIKSSTLKNL